MIRTMATKTKRTYNLSPETISRVRDLAETGRLGGSQDRVVEVAVEQLYLGVRAQQEAASWARAAEDPEFMAEMRGLEAAFGELERWPE